MKRHIFLTIDLDIVSFFLIFIWVVDMSTAFNVSIMNGQDNECSLNISADDNVHTTTQDKRKCVPNNQSYAQNQNLTNPSFPEEHIQSDNVYKIIINNPNDTANCTAGSCFHHNMTIPVDLLPALVRPRNQVILFQGKLKQHIIRDPTITNFVLQNGIILVVMSKSFDSILNPSSVKLLDYYEPKTPVDAGIICLHDATCSANFGYEFPLCYCDSVCQVYNDCCLNAPNNPTYTPEVEEHTYKRMYMSCIENEYISPNDYSGYWTVSSCPAYQSKLNELDEEQYTFIKKRCEAALDDAYFVPVVSKKTGINYRNAYCALCHDEYIFEYWRQRFSSLLAKKHNEILSVHPPRNYKGRTCFNFTFSSCPEEVETFPYGRFLSKYCRSHQNPAASRYPLDQTNFPNITSSVLVHRNLYCFICNTHYIILKPLMCLRDLCCRLYDLPSYVWLFRFNPKLTFPQKIEKCPDGEIWQSFLRKCMKRTCKNYHSNGCVEYTDMNTTALVQAYLIKGNFTEVHYDSFIRRVHHNIHQILRESTNIKYKPFDQCVADGFLVLNLLTRFKDFTTDSEIAKQLIFEKWTFLNSRYDKVDLIYVPVSSRYLSSDTSMYDLNNSFSPLYNNTRYHITCFSDNLKKYRPRVYGKFETCTFSNFYQTTLYLEHKHKNPFLLRTPTEEIILTYLAMGCSSITLAIRLFYGFKRRHRTISSIKGILFHCMFVKLMSQIVFLVGSGANDIELMCYIIGVVLHYLWLSSFVWSCICAYFFYNVFVLAMCNMRSIMLTSNSSILGFTVIGYASPLFVIFLSVAVDLLKYDEAEMSYGKKICFITGKETLLFGFAYPTCFMIFLNFIFFLNTIWHMVQLNYFTTSWLEKLNRYLPVCIKMSVILSLTWGMGFLASWLDSPAFWLVFILMDGIQGCLLAFSSLPCKSTLNASKHRSSK